MLGSAIGAGEERILPVQCYRPDAALDDIAIDLDPPVVEEQPHPNLGRVGQPEPVFDPGDDDRLRDPFGHVWVLLTWKEDLEPAEMERRGNALLQKESASERT